MIRAGDKITLVWPERGKTGEKGIRFAYVIHVVGDQLVARRAQRQRGGSGVLTRRLEDEGITWLRGHAVDVEIAACRAARALTVWA